MKNNVTFSAERLVTWPPANGITGNTLYLIGAQNGNELTIKLTNEAGTETKELITEASVVALINAAVANNVEVRLTTLETATHTHANQAVLDGLSADANGFLMSNGMTLDGGFVFKTNEW